MSKDGSDRPRDELDDAIDRCRMEARTGLTHDALHRRIRKATLCLNIAYCLADVMESLVMDADSLLAVYGASLEREDKMNFKRLAKAMRDTRKCAQRCTEGLYRHQEADDFADDCDFWYNMVKLVSDRVGADRLKAKQVTEWLLKMPSVLGMFDLRNDDFKTYRL